MTSTDQHPDPRAALREALSRAVKARDRVAVRALRSALAAVANAEAVPVDTVERAGAVEATAVGVGANDRPRRELDPHAVREVVRSEHRELVEAADGLASTHPERADVLRAEAAVLERVLDGTP